VATTSNVPVSVLARNSSPTAGKDAQAVDEAGAAALAALARLAGAYRQALEPILTANREPTSIIRDEPGGIAPGSETAVVDDLFFNTGFLMAGSNEPPTFASMGAYLTSNSGASWSVLSSPTALSPSVFSSDPGIAFDPSNVYYSLIGVDKSFSTRLYVAQKASFQNVQWSYRTLTDPGVELPDKSLIAVDNTSG